TTTTITTSILTLTRPPISGVVPSLRCPSTAGAPALCRQTCGLRSPFPTIPPIPRSRVPMVIAPSRLLLILILTGVIRPNLFLHTVFTILCCSHSHDQKTSVGALVRAIPLGHQQWRIP